MILAEIYEAYTVVMKAFDRVLEELSGKEELVQTPETLESLTSFREKLEVLMKQISEFHPQEEEMHNFNDLRYLIADHYFLAGDLCHLYLHNEGGRAKLRILNYLNKKRRSEFFSS